MHSLKMHTQQPLTHLFVFDAEICTRAIELERVPRHKRVDGELASRRILRPLKHLYVHLHLLVTETAVAVTMVSMFTLRQIAKQIARQVRIYTIHV